MLKCNLKQNKNEINMNEQENLDFSEKLFITSLTKSLQDVFFSCKTIFQIKIFIIRKI